MNIKQTNRFALRAMGINHFGISSVSYRYVIDISLVSYRYRYLIGGSGIGISSTSHWYRYRYLIGIASVSGSHRFWDLIDGSSIAAEFDALDKHLNRQTAFAIAAGGALTIVALGWAFTRLQRTNRLLAQRTES